MKKSNLAFSVTVAVLTSISLFHAAFAAENPGPQRDTPIRYALTGTLVTPSEIIPDGTIFIVGEKIEAVGKDVQVPDDVRIIKTNSFIYPGLIDIHDHITWNCLQRWKPREKFNNRYDWQVRDDYFAALKTPHDDIVAQSPSPRPSPKEDLACDANQYGEVKALVGGATSIVDSLGADTCVKGLVRNLNSYSGLYCPGIAEQLRNEVFPLELLNDVVSEINRGLEDGHHALVAHLAEGKQKDASSAREFRMFKARGFLRDGVSIIHGVALSQPNFQEMADHHVGLIWSPHSNFELYGETTDVRSAKACRVEMALAPDWSPTGSNGALEELNYAAAWNANQNPPVFTDIELIKMVTVNPAELAKLDEKIGSLTQNHFADMLVIRSEKSDAYQALLTADPRDIRLVIIGGSPVYGDEDLMHTVEPGTQLDPVHFCNTVKFLNLESERILQSRPPKPWKDTVAALTKELKTFNLPLAKLAACEESPRPGR